MNPAQYVPLLEGNNRPPQINPVLQIFVPMFMQTLHDLIAAEVLSDDIVDMAWEIATGAFAKLGLEYVSPLGCQPINAPEA